MKRLLERKIHGM